MSGRSASARRALVATVLVAVLAVLAIEATHGAHHVGAGLSSDGCATCAVTRTPVVPIDTTTIGGDSVQTGLWSDLIAWCEPTAGAVRPAASRGPPVGA